MNSSVIRWSRWLQETQNGVEWYPYFKNGDKYYILLIKQTMSNVRIGRYITFCACDDSSKRVWMQVEGPGHQGTLDQPPAAQMMSPSSTPTNGCQPAQQSHYMKSSIKLQTLGKIKSWLMPVRCSPPEECQQNPIWFIPWHESLQSRVHRCWHVVGCCQPVATCSVLPTS